MRLFLCLCLLLLTLQPATAENLRGKVTWIYDGDTLKVAGVGKVRLIGIDAPEHADSDRDRFYRRWNIPPARLRKIAAAGKRFQIRTVKGKVVRLQFDRERKDKYGRTLAYVILPDGRMLNRLLLKKGYATVFRRYDFKFKDDFLKIEKKARKQQVGLWKRPQSG
ncbi:thermonuclease [Geothermobacter hydrogeniphilus]|uniref:Thermonuclease n=1 Tax=Geothermobacter hydrogeniphilus TaxID=1969733 RepID=A0A2K2H697_9BACT|nr:thermonuclease family protein [Geothermobacter hydrogeniphilus]PNU18771.1 thermonuclease [Geothermobacter hydrogeniphilus]